MKWQEHSQKFKLKSVSGQKQGCIQILEASKKTQQSSKLTQQHLIFPKKAKIRAYVTVCKKSAYIRGYSRETRMYTWLWRKNPCTGRKIDKNKVGNWGLPLSNSQKPWSQRVRGLRIGGLDKIVRTCKCIHLGFLELLAKGSNSL